MSVVVVKCCLYVILRCNLAAVRVGLLLPAKQLVRNAVFCTGQRLAGRFSVKLLMCRAGR